MDGSLFPDAPIVHAPQRISGGSRRRTIASSSASWILDDGITVVLFAGMGGACAGLEDAGCHVHVANNHDEVALAAHAALHPHTRHIRGDIFDVDPLVATRGKRVKVLWASPDCTDHSVAKGGAPRSPRVRSLPWQVCRWAGKTDADVIFVENVREIRGWGPLVAKRCKVTGRVMKLDGAVAAPGERVHVRDQILVRDKKRLGRSFRRWKGHLAALGYNYEDRDMNCADYGVPTARRRFFAVARKDGFPIRWPARTHAPVAEAEALGLQPWVAASTILDWSIPLPSIFERKRPLADATMRRIAAGIMRYVINNPRPFIVPLTHTGSIRTADGAEPLPTLTTAHRGEFAVVSPSLAQFYGEKDDGNPRAADPAQPLPTSSTSNRFGVVGAYIAPVLTGCGGRAAQVPPTEVTTPLGTSTTKGDRILVGATLVQTGYGEREGQAPRALNIEAPIGTQVAGASKHAIVQAWMIQHNTGVTGHEATEPMSTMTTAGTQQQVGAAFLAKLRGESTANSVEEPVGTFSAGGNHIASVAAFITKYYGEGGVAQGVDEPLHTISTKARFGLVTVTIEGEPYVITDIGMRMLEPSEAAAAHELRLPEMITLNGETKRLTKSQAMRLVGNSVPKRMAKLLAEANAVHTLYAAEMAEQAA